MVQPNVSAIVTLDFILDYCLASFSASHARLLHCLLSVLLSLLLLAFLGYCSYATRCQYGHSGILSDWFRCWHFWSRIQDQIWLRTTKFGAICLAHTSKQINYVSVAFIPWSCPWISQHPTEGYRPNELVAAGLHRTPVSLFLHAVVQPEDAD